MAHGLPVTTTPPPVGVRRLGGANDAATVSVYHGVSYCGAVHRAGAGEPLRVLPGSIEVCGWSPIVLGLWAPQGTFEGGLSPRLPHPVTGLLLAPLDRFPGEPEVVLVRAPRDTVCAMIQATPPAALWDRHRNQIELSALPRLIGSDSRRRERLIAAVNQALAALAPSSHWQALTHRVFRSPAVTAGFDALISRTLADMSICRNSTAIPLLTARANVSFFCTGAITWGLNDPAHLTSGWPLPIYHSLISSTHYSVPGSQRSTP
ncbi:MAG TPA: hypothetical protein VLC95_19835 [Anaerolineae bacterium]|nr:hypothetical protein [Anaerolineae bacterium]